MRGSETEAQTTPLIHTQPGTPVTLQVGLPAITNNDVQRGQPLVPIRIRGEGFASNQLNSGVTPELPSAGGYGAMRERSKPTAGSRSEPSSDLMTSNVAPDGRCQQRRNPHRGSERSIRDRRESSEFFWDAAEQNAKANSREGARVNLGALALLLLAKPAELSCLLLQRPLELDDDLFAARHLLP
jgi:hypothetical protein